MPAAAVPAVGETPRTAPYGPAGRLRSAQAPRKEFRRQARRTRR